MLVKNLELKLSKIETLPLKYLKTRKVFVNYKESCLFNPETGYGHSYGWYTLSCVIKGHLVLNTYGYSSATRLHVSKFMDLFKLLGLKYVTIEAPSGLQANEATKAHQARLYARAEVEHKYARIKDKNHVANQRKLLATAKLLGLCPSQAMIKEAIKQAEINRSERLDRIKAKRHIAKTFQLITDNQVSPYGNSNG